MQHTNSGSIPRATKPRPSRYVIRDPLDRYVGVEGARSSPPWRHAAAGEWSTKIPGWSPPECPGAALAAFSHGKPRRLGICQLQNRHVYRLWTAWLHRFCWHRCLVYSSIHERYHLPPTTQARERPGSQGAEPVRFQHNVGTRWMCMISFALAICPQCDVLYGIGTFQ